jgi:hypothetical protein
MSELTNQQDKIEQKRKFDGILGRMFILGVIISILCLSFYCIIIPATTGQNCLDPASGHVPEKAKKIFLDKVFDSIVKQNYEWLSTVSTTEALNQLKEIQPMVTENYKIIRGDDLAGMYERVIQFDNGVEIYLVFFGSWSCPDFSITEEEVFQRLKLAGIEKQEQE